MSLDAPSPQLLFLASHRRLPQLRAALRKASEAMPEAFTRVVVEGKALGRRRRVSLPLPRAAVVFGHPAWMSTAAQVIAAEVTSQLAMIGPHTLTLEAGPDALPLCEAAAALLGSEGHRVLWDLAARLRGAGEVSLQIQAGVEGDEAPPADVPPPLEVSPEPRWDVPTGLWVGVDVGGSDVKIVVLNGGEATLAFAWPWDHPPHTWPSAQGWLPALKTLVYGALWAADKGDEALQAALISGEPLLAIEALLKARGALGSGGWAGPLPCGVGLSFPDVVVGDGIVGGITGKAAGVRQALGEASGAYWADFDAYLRPLAAQLGQALGGAPVVPIGDGHVASILAAAAGDAPPALTLSLGTSVALGLVDSLGRVPDIPAYASHLIIEVNPASGAEHDTTGVAGVAQKGPCQKGAFARCGPGGPLEAMGRGLPDGSDKARFRALLRQAQAGDGRLLRALGEALADTVAEALHALSGWQILPEAGPLPVRLFGRLVEGAGDADAPATAVLEAARRALAELGGRCGEVQLVPASAGAAGLAGAVGLPAEDVETLGQALGALLYAARELGHRCDAPPAAARRGALARMRAPRAPGAGYDIYLLTAAHAAEASAQRARFEALFGGRPGPSGADVRVYSVVETWPGGAGNLLGTLHAWALAREAAAAEGVDLDARWAGGARIALIHNGGAGKRCSPLVQAQNNARGALILPGEAPGGGALSLLEAVALTAAPLAAANNGDDLDVYWASQLIVGEAPPEATGPSPFLFTKLCQSLPAERVPSPSDLHDLGLFETDAHGAVLDFHAQGTFPDARAFAAWRGKVDGAAFDLGSFRLKRPLFRALLAHYGDALEARRGKRDLDPHFTQPLVALLKGVRRRGLELASFNDGAALVAALAQEDRDRLAAFATTEEVAAFVVSNAPLLAGAEGVVGLASLGAALRWWRLRRPSEIYAFALSAVADLGAPRTEAAERRALMGIAHPITRCQLGSVFIEGPEVSWEAVAEGVTLGGVRVQGAILRGCSLQAGSSVVGSVLEEVSGRVEARASVAIRVDGPRMALDGALAYGLAAAEPLTLREAVEVGVYRPGLDGGVARVRSTFDVDAKAADDEVVAGNAHSFRALRETFDTPEGPEGDDAWLAARRRAREAAGLPIVDQATPAERVAPALREALGKAIPPGAAWLTALEERGLLNRACARGLAAWAAEAVRRELRHRLDGGALGEGGGDELSARCLTRLDLLAAVACHADPTLAQTAVGPFFAGILEGLSDDLSPQARRLSSRVMCRVWSQIRRAESAAAFDRQLAGLGMRSEAELYERHRRLREEAPPPLPDPAEVLTIAVLPRVTVGAEIAISTALIGRLLAAFPKARILYVADPKMGPLVSHPRIELIPFKFARRGTLIDRLGAWRRVVDILAERQPDLVFDPDSRVSQLGSVPVIKGAGRYYYWENSAPMGEAAPMASLLGRWLDSILPPGPTRPTLWLSPVLPAFAADVWCRLDLDGRPAVSVKYDVGGQAAKSLGLAFEDAHLRALLRAGQVVLLDRGFAPDELAKAERHLASARALGAAVVEVTDLPDGLGSPVAELQPAPPGPVLVVFHGTIGGWLALAGHCHQAFSYDSVHQHGALADRIFADDPPGAPRPGADVITLFAGHPTPAFPKVWRPMGQGRLEAVVVEDRRRWPEALAQVLAHHHRFTMALTPRSGPPGASPTPWPAPNWPQSWSRRQELSRQLRAPAASWRIPLPEATAAALEAGLPTEGLYTFLRYLLGGGRLSLFVHRRPGLPLAGAWAPAAGGLSRAELHIPLETFAALGPGAPLARLIVEAFAYHYACPELGVSRGDVALRVGACFAEGRASGAEPAGAGAQEGAALLAKAYARWMDLSDGDGLVWAGYRRRILAAYATGSLSVRSGPALLALYRALLDAALAQEPTGGAGQALWQVRRQLEADARAGRLAGALLEDDRWVFSVQREGFAGGEAVYLPQVPWGFSEASSLEAAPLDDGDDVASGLAERALSRRGGGALVVGIIAPGGAGKTTLSQRLCRAFEARGLSVASVGADAWLWPGAGFRYTQKGEARITHLRGPGIYLDPDLALALEHLKAGGEMILPYDAYGGRGPLKVHDVDVVICDGVFVGLDAQVRQSLDFLIGIVADGRSGAPRLAHKLSRDEGPGSVRRIDVITDFAEKVFYESIGGIKPVFERWCDVIWDRGQGRLWQRRAKGEGA